MTQDHSEISVSVADLARFVVRDALPSPLLAEATLPLARTSTGFAQFGLTPVTAPPIELGAYSVAALSDGVLTDALRQLGEADPSPAPLRLRSDLEARER